MSHFGELVDDDEDSIISTLGLRKTSDEVHFDMIELPFWNRKRLERSSWSLVFCFHPSADITLIHELSDLTLHSSPPIRLLEVMVHLRTSRMNRQERIVRFVHNDFTEITLWNHNPVLEEKSISVINSIALVFGNALVNTTFHLLHHGIQQLCLTNLIFQSRRDYEVGQETLRNNLKIQLSDSLTKIRLKGLED